MKLKRLIAKQGVDLTEEDSSDIERVVDGAYKAFSLNRLNICCCSSRKSSIVSVRKVVCMRWHLLIIRFALHIQYKSSAAYRALGQF